MNSIPLVAILMTLLSVIFLAAVVSSDKIEEPVENVDQKTKPNKGNKRSLYGLGYGYGGYGTLGDHGLDYGTLGGYGLGSALTLPSYGSAIDYPSYPGALSSYAGYGTPIQTTITKHVAVPVPQPIAVPVERHVPYAVPSPYPVEVPRPYPVEVPKPVAVPIERPYPVPVDRPYPVAVPVYKHVRIPHHYPVFSKEISAIPWTLSKSIYSHPTW